MPAWCWVPAGPVCEGEIWVLRILRHIHPRLGAAKVHKYIILSKAFGELSKQTTNLHSAALAAPGVRRGPWGEARLREGTYTTGCL